MTFTYSVNTRTVLLVEDNAADVRLMEEAFKEENLRHTLHVAEDGEKAMAFLWQEGEFSQAPSPDLILLDLNLPRKNGREVLADIKSDPGLRHIPVVVLTTSRSEQDIVNSYNLHANCYIIKPVDLDRFMSVVKSITSFWFTVVALPGRETDV